MSPNPRSPGMARAAKKAGRTSYSVHPAVAMLQRWIAELKPATRTRIDLGFALGDRPVVGRLIDTGGVRKKNRITRRIPITSLADIDDEVTRWLKTAYDLDA